MESNKRFWVVHTQWSHHGGEFQRTSYSLSFFNSTVSMLCVAVFGVFSFFSSFYCVWTLIKYSTMRYLAHGYLLLLFYSCFGSACLLCADELYVVLQSRCNPEASHYALHGFSTLYNSEMQWENIRDGNGVEMWIVAHMFGLTYTVHVRAEMQ